MLGSWALADTPPSMVKGGSGQRGEGLPHQPPQGCDVLCVSGPRCRQEDQGGEASGGDGRR